jgi:hypothetical protein
VDGIYGPGPGDVAGNLHGGLGHHSSSRRFLVVWDFTRVPNFLIVTV